jgi:hypothetical protein
MWMWGDRLLDAKATKLGKWEASDNGTESAVDLLPKDIVICDWHYNKAPETPRFFAKKGFDVVACPWRKASVALEQLAHIQSIRSGTDEQAAPHALGLLQTTWGGFAAFNRAYQNRQTGPTPEKNGASESTECFATLLKAIREKQ